MRIYTSSTQTWLRNYVCVYPERRRFDSFRGQPYRKEIFVSKVFCADNFTDLFTDISTDKTLKLFSFLERAVGGTFTPKIFSKTLYKLNLHNPNVLSLGTLCYILNYRGREKD